MSAELLREAAAQIRADMSDTEDDLYLAIAEWLEMTADYVDLGLDSRHPGWRGSKYHALTYARALLGVSS